MKPNEFINKLNELNIKYTNDMLEQLREYYQYLKEYNSHTNLTAITNEEDVYLKHFYDSLTLTKVINFNNVNSLLDIGSGAGFPGIVIKIFFPHLKVTVLDSNNKKTTFMSSLISKLGLKDINVINDRAENYAVKNIKYDVITSRAVAYIDIITTLSSYFTQENSVILLMKGDITNELTLLKRYQQELNIHDYNVISCNLDNNNIRNIIKIHINNQNQKIMNYSQISKRHDKWTK